LSVSTHKDRVDHDQHAVGRQANGPSETMTKTVPIIRLTLRDEPEATAKLRDAVEHVANRCGLGSEDAFDLKVAATEAVTNALKSTGHAQAVTVVADEREHAIEIEVADAGSFRQPERPAGVPAEAEGGRGIPLMLALVDELEFASTGDGTRVRMRKRLPSRGRP
jgi:serine/threonine-protein kinase RsbW